MYRGFATRVGELATHVGELASQLASDDGDLALLCFASEVAAHDGQLALRSSVSSLLTAVRLLFVMVRLSLRW